MLAQIGQQLLQVLGSTHLSVGDADFAIGLAMHLAGCALLRFPSLAAVLCVGLRALGVT